MPRRKEKPVEEPFRPCDREGCEAHAAHRAPKSKDDDNQYFWFCLDHVREYNQKWDYFSGMGPDEIESFRRDAVIGHRPTWHMSSNSSRTPAHLGSALRRFFFFEEEKYVAPPIPSGLRKALSVLDLEHPTSKKNIKSTYKKLVKRYHPDVNQGDNAAAERFKSINEAYHQLMDAYPEVA